MTLLTLSGMDDVVEILRELEPSSEETGEKIRKLIGYLEKNRDRIDYEGDKFEGFPIGSGAIESANKFICHKRMKVSGACFGFGVRWSMGLMRGFSTTTWSGQARIG